MEDGFVLFYVKDNEVLPVAMDQEKLDRLQFLIKVVFDGKTPQVVNKSQGTVENLIKKVKT